ncbi:MAG: hypothetical protein NTZ08_01525 [Verrucomicrobia bacterium]|nr:hypothetical protein [Verrucomicrobiota bacterium]
MNNSTSSLETLDRYPVCADSGAFGAMMTGKSKFIASYFIPVFKSPEKRAFSTSSNEWSNRLTRYFATFSPAIANFAFGE